jgi:subtilase family serine protease
MQEGNMVGRLIRLVGGCAIALALVLGTLMPGLTAGTEAASLPVLRPDLTVSAQLPSFTTLEVTVTNVGTAPVVTNYVNVVTVNGRTHFVRGVALFPGKSVTLSFDVFCEPHAEVTVDVFNSVRELNEDNNSASADLFC